MGSLYSLVYLLYHGNAAPTQFHRRLRFISMVRKSHFQFKLRGCLVLVHRVAVATAMIILSNSELEEPAPSPHGFFLRANNHQRHARCHNFRIQSLPLQKNRVHIHSPV